VALTWQGSWCQPRWRQSLALASLAPRLGAKTPLLNSHHSSSQAILIFFLLLVGFFLCPLQPTSSIDILDRGKLDFIRRSSRAMYPLTLPSLFRIDLVKSSHILNLWNFTCY
jgi:hypothetical protein